MKLRFVRTLDRETFWTEQLRMKDGEIAEVPSQLARKLLEQFPKNFQTLEPPSKKIQSVKQKYSKIYRPAIQSKRRCRVKVQFNPSGTRESYWGENLRIGAGEITDVDRNTADRLINTFPENFTKLILTVEELGLPLHQPLKLSQITVLTIHHAPPEVLESNLLSCLPKEVEFIKLENHDNRNFSSAAKALNHGIRKSRNNVIICAHEDLILKKGWFKDFTDQECKLKKWGALGIVGMGIDRGMYWGKDYIGPCKAETLDECCIIVNRKNGIWFDEKTFTGWHCYGVDFCLQARNKGLNIYVLSGPATHGHVSREAKGYASAEKWLAELEPIHQLLRQKWGKLFPTIITTTGVA